MVQQFKQINKNHIMLEVLKRVQGNKVEFVLEGINNKQGTQLGMMISKLDEDGRHYLSQPQSMEEAMDHLEFYQRVYK
jgi:hypothetical protein